MGAKPRWVLPVVPSELSAEEAKALASELYERWSEGERKSPLELEYFANATSHGKFFSAFVRKWTGLETETKSLQSEHLERLESLLRVHGISPSDAGDLAEEFRLIAKSRESALAALRVFNDPLAGFRTETFVLLMIVAWNALLQGILEVAGTDYYERDGSGRVVEVGGRGRVKDTAELIELALPGPTRQAMRCNLDFFLKLRNVIAHRYLPALDPKIMEEAQATLINFESVLIEHFGDEAKLGDQLAVPLQLSGFRNTYGQAALKRAQSVLPIDVSDFLTRHRADVPEEVLRSHEYALRIFFVPVAANRERSADTMVHFITRDQYPELVSQLERQLAVVDKPKQVSVASADLLRPSEVVNLVAERLPFRFTADTHTRAWKYFKARPPTSSSEPEATDQRYCRWDRLMRGYGYTHAWVDMLIQKLSLEEQYEAVVGVRPDRR